MTKVKIADEKLKHYFDIFHEQDHDYHRDMLRRNESMKGKHREFVNYLKYKGYQINDTTVSKDYDKSEVKWIDETTLDKSKFAWNVKSYTVNKFDVTVNYDLAEFIHSFSLDLGWDRVYVH